MDGPLLERFSIVVASLSQVHFVFFNTKYTNAKSAKEKEDGIAVLAVFLKVRLLPCEDVL